MENRFLLFRHNLIFKLEAQPSIPFFIFRLSIFSASITRSSCLNFTINQQSDNKIQNQKIFSDYLSSSPSDCLSFRKFLRISSHSQYIFCIFIQLIFLLFILFFAYFWPFNFQNGLNCQNTGEVEDYGIFFSVGLVGFVGDTIFS